MIPRDGDAPPKIWIYMPRFKRMINTTTKKNGYYLCTQCHVPFSVMIVPHFATGDYADLRHGDPINVAHVYCPQCEGEPKLKDLSTIPAKLVFLHPECLGLITNRRSDGK